MNALPDPLHALPAGLVWRGARFAGTPPPGRPSGFAALDAVLPGGGWPEGALVELLCDQPGIGELSLLLPLMRAVEPPRWLAWIAPPLPPYAPALAAAGVPLDRLLWIVPSSSAETRWAIRQALASGSCALVLAWLEGAEMATLRRLQLAAEEGGTPLFLFRPGTAGPQPSPAVLRLRLRPADAGRLRLDVLKRRGPPLAEPLELLLEERLATRATPFPPQPPELHRRSRTRARFRPDTAAGSAPPPPSAHDVVARTDPARSGLAGDPARVG